MSEGRDYENQILTQLYSRKATRKAFEMIAADYRKATGSNLCTVIQKAQRDIMQKTDKEYKSGKDMGTSLRTDAFKMIDYSTWLRFCPTGAAAKTKVGLRGRLKAEIV